MSLAHADLKVRRCAPGANLKGRGRLLGNYRNTAKASSPRRWTLRIAGEGEGMRVRLRTLATGDEGASSAAMSTFAGAFTGRCARALVTTSKAI